MLCRKCNKRMRRVMSFTDKKAYEFHRCPTCWYETKKSPLNFLHNTKTQENYEDKQTNKSKRIKGKTNKR